MQIYNYVITQSEKESSEQEYITTKEITIVPVRNKNGEANAVGFVGIQEESEEENAYFFYPVTSQGTGGTVPIAGPAIYNFILKIEEFNEREGTINIVPIKQDNIYEEYTEVSLTYTPAQNYRFKN